MAQRNITMENMLEKRRIEVENNENENVQLFM